MLRQTGKIRSEEAGTIGQRAPLCPSHIPRTIATERTTVDVKTMIVQHFHNVQLIFSEKNLVTPVSNYVERTPPAPAVQALTYCERHHLVCAVLIVL